jgi:mannose-1-phosphate guanylyltransferase / mannose-6-phosphate isomerase
LITHRDATQSVKQVVDALNAKADPRTQVHLTVHRPWGSYTVLEDKTDCKVKRLTVRPGQVLSLQLHHRRAEHWTVVTGTARVTIGEESFDLPAGRACYIPVNTRHRLENQTNEDIHLIEVQVGSYFGEDDIVRFEDRYGRV